MKLKLLEQIDSDLLFAFEVENKNWFESFIAPRGESFYNPPDINKHIASCIQEYSKGTAYFFVVVNEHEIIGRINLREICLKRKTASLGYRVAKKHAGKGVASFALSTVVNLARKELNLQSLISYVLTNNPASERVLLKQGFTSVKTHKDYMWVNNEVYDSKEYLLTL